MTLKKMYGIGQLNFFRGFRVGPMVKIVYFVEYSELFLASVQPCRTGETTSGRVSLKISFLSDFLSMNPFNKPQLSFNRVNHSNLLNLPMLNQDMVVCVKLHTCIHQMADRSHIICGKNGYIFLCQNVPLQIIMSYKSEWL